MSSTTSLKFRVFSAGLAMFSMFFGAGNVVFPLLIGQVAKQQTCYAIIGFILTAVCVPFLGLSAILFFAGDYRAFFSRLGLKGGMLVTAFIMLLIGPLGALPRCIALSYSTLQISFPGLSVHIFALIACGLIYLCTYRKSAIVDTLGWGLTPLLLLNLLIIVVAGFYYSNPEALASTSLNSFQAFSFGLEQGYNTMDLLGSFFFSSMIFMSLKDTIGQEEGGEINKKKLFKNSLKASLIGAFLLGTVYIGFSFIGAFHGATALGNSGELLGYIALNTLGNGAGLIASATIALACLTTAIALAAAFAEFLQKDVCKSRISYSNALIGTLAVSYGVSTLEFTGIVSWLTPILQWIYPALIAFTIASLISSLTQKERKKEPAVLS